MANPSPSEVTSELRRKMLSEYPAQLGRDPKFKDSPALGVLMETGFDKAVVSLVSCIDGNASVYFSSGGGIIGGVGHLDIRIAAQRFTQFAAIHIPEMSKCVDYPMPNIGHTTFYVITSNGTLTVTAPEAELGGGSHPFSPLFHTGHYLFTRLRMTLPKKENKPTG
jgi:hypothetical protein